LQDGSTSRSKVVGEGVPDSKVDELPASPAGAKDLEKAGANTLVDPALFDPVSGGIPGSPFRTGRRKAPPDFPTWQDPELRERNRAMGLDLLTSPLYVPESDERSGGIPVDEEVSEPAPFVTPGFYGRAPNVLFPGQGRAAWPWNYHVGFSIINGYDSNGFQAPDNAQTAIPQEQQGSFTSGVGLHLDMQWANAHSIFTLDVNGTGTYYWNRDEDKTLFNIPTFALLYSRQLNPRTQLAVNLSLNYLSQADYSNLYASQNGGGGDYLTASSKIDVTHKWAPHFSTDTSVAVNLLYYPQGNEGVIPLGSGTNASSSQLDITIGNAFQFATSPRLTWVVEGRYGLQEVLDNSTLNSDTLYFLAGLDWIWLRHVTTSVRAGATSRKSDTFGNSTSPYFEASGNIKTGRHSSLNLNARYGFEFTDIGGNDSPSFRVGLSYQQVLGRRLSGSAGIGYVNGASTQFDSSSSSTTAVDVTMGLQYQVSRHFSWDARYTFTQSDSSSGQQNYSRSLATVAARWNF